jgi:hypothetical protein
MCYEVKGHEENVLNLNETLYGLKQAWRAWYSRIDDKERGVFTAFLLI